MEKDKRAQRGTERLIDADRLCEEFDIAHPVDYYTPFIVETINEQPTVEAIPTAWIVAQIQDTCGAESSYYSRLLRKWREEQNNVGKD